MKMTLNSWVILMKTHQSHFSATHAFTKPAVWLEKSELGNAATWAADLHNVMEEIRAKYNLPSDCGTAQLGHCMNIDGSFI
jgi:hypothetical protein